MSKTFYTLCLLTVVLACSVTLAFVAGEVHEARALNAEIKAALALPADNPEPTPGPLSSPASVKGIF